MRTHGGLLEHRIRSVPGVAGCALDEDEIVVLPHPDTDPQALATDLAVVARAGGWRRSVRVLTRERPIPPSGRYRRLLVVGVIALVVVALASTILGTVAGGGFGR